MHCVTAQFLEQPIATDLRASSEGTLSSTASRHAGSLSWAITMEVSYSSIVVRSVSESAYSSDA